MSVIVSHRITESTSSCVSAGTTPGWSCRQTSSPILLLLTQRCLNASGNLICFLQMRRAPTSTMSPKRISSFSYSAMETSSSAWGNYFFNNSNNNNCFITYKLYIIKTINNNRIKNVTTTANNNNNNYFYYYLWVLIIFVLIINELPAWGNQLFKIKKPLFSNWTFILKF